MSFTRFIPTRAGNTFQRPGRPVAGAVHPHSRGEHFGAARGNGLHAGSSPLARGTRHIGTQALEALRFIPTRAGNTNTGCTSRPTMAVHPHSRGEHGTGVSNQPAGIGSSPLARGTQFCAAGP